MVDSNCFVPGIIHHDMVAKNALNKKNLTPLDMVPDYGRDVEDTLINASVTWSWRKEVSRSQHERKITITKEDRKAAEKKRLAEKKEKLAVIRKISDTNIIVATLIVTVRFATGFTMPGGYNQSGTTNPVPRMTALPRKSAFQAFIILDAIALLLSCVVIFLNFWGTCIDNLETAQKFALVTMLLVTGAIGAMMIAFSTATYVVLIQSSALAIATCLVGVVSIPVSFVLCCRLAPME